MSDTTRIGLPGRAAAMRGFDRASSTFDTADFVHREAQRRLFERLTLVKFSPDVVVDLGAATGSGSDQLAGAFPDARLVCVDRSAAMLARARERCRERAAYLVGDAERLPLAENSVDLLFANLVLPWCAPDAVFAEAARVLREGGVFSFSTLGPDTLAEVRMAWALVDDRIHVHGFADMHDLGDLVARAGFSDPVMDVDAIEVTYQDVDSLVADLRGCGAANVAVGRRTTLTGRARWAGFERALEATRDGERFAVTVELIFGQAFGRGAMTGSRSGETVVSAEDMLRQLRGR
ncbi:MAG TPA: methyltransferase domain-containing protein [Gammaproteobacteria bacterium]